MNEKTTGQSEALGEIYDDIQAVAVHVGSGLSGVTDSDDLAQDIAERLLRDRQVGAVATCEPAARRAYLALVAKQILSGHLTSLEHHSGQYTYSQEEVRALLEAGALVDALTRDVETLFVERLDLCNAYFDKALNEAYSLILWKRFVVGQKMEDRKSVTRAIDALTLLMNKNHEAHDGPGSRQAVSNSTVQYLSGRQENYA